MGRRRQQHGGGGRSGATEKQSTDKVTTAKARTAATITLGDLPREVDVLIIGAGISGLFCAARLREARPDLSVLVVERSGHIGGRLASLSPYPGPLDGKNGEPLTIEMGGMRTFPDIDRYTSAVVRMTGTTTVEVPYIEPNNVAYVRGARVRIGTLPDVAGRLYGLPADERGRAANTLITAGLNCELAAVCRELPGAGTNMATLEDRVFSDEAFSRITLERAVTDRGLSWGGMAYATDVGGYDFIAGALSAAAGVREDYSLSGANSKQHWVIEGYESLPRALLDCAVRGAPDSPADGFHLAYGVDLTALRPLRDGAGVDCWVCDSAAAPCLEAGGDAVQVHDTQRPRRLRGAVKNKHTADDMHEWTPEALGARRVRAKTVILSAPRNDLAVIDAPWPCRATDIMDAVENWRGCKVALRFERVWWVDTPTRIVSKAPAPGESLGAAHVVQPLGLVAGGRNVTDLPARQVWMPFGAREPVVLIYNDQESADYWTDMLPTRDGSLPPSESSPSAPLRKKKVRETEQRGRGWHKVKHAPELVEEVLRQLERVLGVSRADMGRVERVAWRHWPYGTTFWRARYNPPGSVTEMRDYMIQPFGSDVPVLCVGDSFSYSQGWVDGAIETSDMALARRWRIPSVIADHPPPATPRK